MPELPDLEVFKQYADATALHKSIRRVRCREDAPLAEISATTLRRRLDGVELTETRRRGKYLFLRSDRGFWLLLHFGMTGSLRYRKESTDEPDYWKCAFGFTNGYLLYYIDPRKLGKVGIVDDVDEFCRAHDIGPDLSSLSDEALARILRDGRGSIKSTLMNQSIIAGLGNVYSDEILFQAGVDPGREHPNLTNGDIDRIVSTARRVVDEAVAADADPDRMPESYLLPRRREGAECPRCGGTVKKITIGGRSSYLCPRCQSK